MLFLVIGSLLEGNPSLTTLFASTFKKTAIMTVAGRRYLRLLWYLLGVDVVSQVRSEVAVRVGEGFLDLPQRLVILLGPLGALLQLALSERRLGKHKPC